MHVVVQALKAMQRFISGDHWKELELKPTGAQNSPSDAKLEAHVREKGGW
jgi:hypothetical protein